MRNRPVTTPCYPDGRLARVGDLVLMLVHEVEATVEDVIDSEAKRSEWGVDQPGLMLQAPAFGRLFESEPLQVKLLKRSAVS